MSANLELVIRAVDEASNILDSIDRTLQAGLLGELKHDEYAWFGGLAVGLIIGVIGTLVLLALSVVLL